MQDPALSAFLEQPGEQWILAEVQIRREGSGFEVRHRQDTGKPSDALKLLSLPELLHVAQHTATGAFRPLKSAPNLQTGWRFLAENTGSLSVALNYLYPGAIADWFAVRTRAQAPLTSFREFTRRQTGMYRITALLNDAQASTVIAATCDPKFCLKQRLWTVEGLAPDPRENKSLIPCLEPCAILLEFARTSMRIEQEEKVNLELSPSELESVITALEKALEIPNPAIREADFSNPANPRRIRAVLDKARKSGTRKIQGGPPGE